jgi:hypothetical protein
MKMEFLLLEEVIFLQKKCKVVPDFKRSIKVTFSSVYKEKREKIIAQAHQKQDISPK